jgi:hypothetical protein
MKSLCLLILAFTVGFAPVHAQQYPDVGKLIAQGTDHQVNTCIDTGAPLAYDAANQRLTCTTGSSWVILPVTLSQGTLTTVTNTAITESTYVRCGCDVEVSAAEAPSCNIYGARLADKWVRSVQNGLFEIQTSYAIGNEAITCAYRN